MHKCLQVHSLSLMHTYICMHKNSCTYTQVERNCINSSCYHLQVNGIEMTGKSQTEAVTVLRNTKMGSVVNIVVSRQVLEGEENKTQEESNTVQKVTVTCTRLCVALSCICIYISVLYLQIILNNQVFLA